MAVTVRRILVLTTFVEDLNSFIDSEDDGICMNMFCTADNDIRDAGGRGISDF